MCISKVAKEDEDGLVADYRSNLKEWQSNLEGFSHIASTKYYPGKSIIDLALAKIKKQLAILDSFQFIEALLAVSDDWTDTSDDIHDISSFYGTQIATWRKMLESLSNFADNKDAIVGDSKAAAALIDIESIRDNPTPYGHINRIDALVAIVSTVNERVAKEERDAALIVINGHISEVQKTLDTVHADADLSNKALHDLQLIKLAVADLYSIAKIRYFKEQSANHLDSAMELIVEATKPVAPPVTSTGNPPPVPPVVVNAPKPAKVIRAADFNAKSYLETEAEVDDYINKLKTELMAAIKAGQRARIQ